MSDWQAAARRHLLAHILKAGARKSYYCAPGETARSAVSRPHPLTVELAKILLAHAVCWAHDMEDWPGAPPSAAEQRAAWIKAMECAEREWHKARARGDGVNSSAPETPVNPLSQLL